MGNIGLGAGKTYDAIFTNASTLEKGDDVRVAGVSVGEVKEVEHYERDDGEGDVPDRRRHRAHHGFDRRDPLPQPGRRPLPGAGAGQQAPQADPLDEGDTIPVQQTSPSLDLTVLFNGFKPLFQALTPDQVNELSMNLVQVLQGEGGTVRGLLEHTASLTTRWPTATS